MSHDPRSIRNVNKHSVYKAIDLLTKNGTERNECKTTKRAEHKIALYCNDFQSNRKRRRTSLVGFSKSLALSEMQSYVARQDWKHALNLFLKLLEYPIELEPLVWRYAFIILLHANDPSLLQQFLEQCIGSHSLYNGVLLEKLLSLPLERE